LHRLRESLIRDRTKAINQLHGFLLEFGISLPVGKAVIRRLSSVLAEHELPVRLSALLQRLHGHFTYLDEQIKTLDKDIANQLARIAWAIATQHSRYETGPDGCAA